MKKVWNVEIGGQMPDNGSLKLENEGQKLENGDNGEQDRDLESGTGTWRCHVLLTSEHLPGKPGGPVGPIYPLRAEGSRAC